MSQYHKIHTLFKRDLDHPRKPIIEGAWAQPEVEYLAGNPWTFTEKVDGTNIRVYFDGFTFRYGGRTDNASIPAPLVSRLNERFLPQVDVMREGFSDGGIVLYGEGYGPKIQKGGDKYRNDQDFVLFDVRIGPWWLQREDVEDIARKLSLDVVPVIGEGTLFEAIAWARRGIRSTYGDFEAEGIVARPRVELQTRAGNRIIAKIKCGDFQ